MKKNIGKALLPALAVLLTVTAVGTYAYLHSVTATATNTFSSDKSISISLREPNWDGYVFDDNKIIIPDEQVALAGKAVTPVSDADYPNGEGKAGSATAQTLGYDIAGNYLPGDVISKNPLVANTSEKEAVYVAARVAYYIEDETAEGGYSQVSAKTFTEKIGTVRFTDGWSRAVTESDNSEIYLYGTVTKATALAAKQVTQKPLFNQITINSSNDGKLPKFQIKVTGYAIQQANVDSGKALQGFKDDFGF